jgi:hypothetical protein
MHNRWLIAAGFAAIIILMGFAGWLVGNLDRAPDTPATETAAQPAASDSTPSWLPKRVSYSSLALIIAFTGLGLGTLALVGVIVLWLNQKNGTRSVSEDFQRSIREKGHDGNVQEHV